MSTLPEDRILRRIAAFVKDKKSQPLTPAQLEALTIRLIDAMACAALARSEPDSERLMQSFAVSPDAASASLIGGGFASADNAAFCNSYLIRKLDWNDTYIGKNGGHPSDFIGAILAAGEQAGKSWMQILHAIGTGTHVMLDFCDAANALARGWDPSTYVGIAATVAIGCVLDLDEVQIANAVAMTTVSRNMLLARTGRVSTWKNLASASAVRDCMFHVIMAQSGLSGPDPAFTGSFGFEKNISGPLTLELDASRDRSGDSHLKFYPAIYHAQGPLEACIALHNDIAGATIEDVSIEIYDFAIRYTADTPAKWSPANIETADHSLPFLAAHALLRGEFGPGSLHATLHDEKVRALAQRVRVTANPEFSARWPDATPSRVIVTAAGRRYEKQTDYIIGHPMRPLDAASVKKKFLVCATPLCGGKRTEDWYDMLENFSAARTAGELIRGPAAD